MTILSDDGNKSTRKPVMLNDLPEEERNKLLAHIEKELNKKSKPQTGKKCPLNNFEVCRADCAWQTNELYGCALRGLFSKISELDRNMELVNKNLR